MRTVKEFWEDTYSGLDVQRVENCPSVFEHGGDGPSCFLSGLPKNGVVLDFGCGFGRNALYLAQVGYVVAVADISQQAISLCKQRALLKGLTLTEVEWASGSLNCGDRCFDGILAWSVLDHMTLSEAREAVNEFRRVSKPGALVLCSFDADDGDYRQHEHDVLPDGSIRYLSERRQGMIVRFFSRTEILDLFSKGWEVLFFPAVQDGDSMTILCRRLPDEHAAQR